MKNRDYFDVLNISDNQESVDMIQALMGNKCLGALFQNGTAKLYFNSGLREEMNLKLETLLPAQTIQWAWEELTSKDWHLIWQDHFKPIVINNKLAVIPHWENDHPAEITIRIKPGMAFGTGHHETTQLILERLLKENFIGDNVLDLGTGSGILSILAKKMGVEDVTSIDIDPLCEENFHKNCELSNIEKIDFYTLDVHDYKNYDYDVVLANIDKKNIIEILSQYQQSRSKAMIILAGLLKTDFDEIKLCMNSCYIENVEEKGEWISLLVKNRIAKYGK